MNNTNILINRLKEPVFLCYNRTEICLILYNRLFVLNNTALFEMAPIVNVEMMKNYKI